MTREEEGNAVILRLVDAMALAFMKLALDYGNKCAEAEAIRSSVASLEKTAQEAWAGRRQAENRCEILKQKIAELKRRKK